MNDYKLETPELAWESVKMKVFKGQCPSKLNNIMIKGIKESVDESEKWEKLARAMYLFNQMPINDK